MQKCRGSKWMSPSRREMAQRTIWSASVLQPHFPNVACIWRWGSERQKKREELMPEKEGVCVGERGLQGCHNHANAERFIGHNNQSVNHHALLCAGGFFNWLVHLDSTINITRLHTYWPENVTWTFGSLLRALLVLLPFQFLLYYKEQQQHSQPLPRQIQTVFYFHETCFHLY